MTGRMPQGPGNMLMSGIIMYRAIAAETAIDVEAIGRSSGREPRRLLDCSDGYHVSGACSPTRNRSLSSVELIRFHRPMPLLAVLRVALVGPGRITVDQRPQIHRMGGAAHLMF